MKAQNVYDQNAPKRPANLSVNADLPWLAKDSGINLSQSFEEILVTKVRRNLKEQWLEENRDAIASYNDRIERNSPESASHAAKYSMPSISC